MEGGGVLADLRALGLHLEVGVTVLACEMQVVDVRGAVEGQDLNFADHLVRRREGHTSGNACTSHLKLERFGSPVNQNLDVCPGARRCRAGTVGAASLVGEVSTGAAHAELQLAACVRQEGDGELASRRPRLHPPCERLSADASCRDGLLVAGLRVSRTATLLLDGGGDAEVLVRFGGGVKSLAETVVALSGDLELNITCTPDRGLAGLEHVPCEQEVDKLCCVHLVSGVSLQRPDDDDLLVPRVDVDERGVEHRGLRLVPSRCVQTVALHGVDDALLVFSRVNPFVVVSDKSQRHACASCTELVLCQTLHDRPCQQDEAGAPHVQLVKVAVSEEDKLRKSCRARPAEGSSLGLQVPVDVEVVRVLSPVNVQVEVVPRLHHCLGTDGDTVNRPCTVPVAHIEAAAGAVTSTEVEGHGAGLVIACKVEGDTLGV